MASETFQSRKDQSIIQSVEDLKLNNWSGRIKNVRIERGKLYNHDFTCVFVCVRVSVDGEENIFNIIFKCAVGGLITI